MSIFPYNSNMTKTEQQILTTNSSLPNIMMYGCNGNFDTSSQSGSNTNSMIESSNEMFDDEDDTTDISSVFTFGETDQISNTMTNPLDLEDLELDFNWDETDSYGLTDSFDLFGLDELMSEERSAKKQKQK